MKNDGRLLRARCIYPGLYAWMQSQAMSLHAFSQMLDIAYSHAYRLLTGDTMPRMPLINKILRATGMTYEEAFGDPRKESESA